MRKFMILGSLVALVVAALALPALAQQEDRRFGEDRQNYYENLWDSFEDRYEDSEGWNAFEDRFRVARPEHQRVRSRRHIPRREHSQLGIDVGLPLHGIALQAAREPYREDDEYHSE